MQGLITTGWWNQPKQLLDASPEEKGIWLATNKTLADAANAFAEQYHKNGKWMHEDNEGYFIWGFVCDAARYAGAMYDVTLSQEPRMVKL